MDALPLRCDTRQGLSAVSTGILHNNANPSNEISQGKGIQGIQIKSENINTHLFANNKIIYIENARESIEKFLELINNFSSVVGYKVNPPSYFCILTMND